LHENKKEQQAYESKLWHDKDYPSQKNSEFCSQAATAFGKPFSYEPPPFPQQSQVAARPEDFS